MGKLMWWPIPVALLAAVGLYFMIDSSLLFGFLPSFAFAGVESDLRANWGALGDVMGGLLNPILTFISIVLLIQTIRISQKTLRQTEKSLQTSNRMLEATHTQIDLNRRELEATRDEITRSSDAQEEISRTQLMQRKENSFYEVYKLLSEVIQKAHAPNDVRTNKKSDVNTAFSGVLQNPSDRWEHMSEYQVDTNPTVASILRLSVACFELGADLPTADRLVSALYSRNLRWFIMIYSAHSSRSDAVFLRDVIVSGRIFQNEPISFFRISDSRHDDLKELADELGVSY